MLSKGWGMPWLAIQIVLLKKLSQSKIFSKRRRLKFARSSAKRLGLLTNAFLKDSAFNAPHAHVTNVDVEIPLENAGTAQSTDFIDDKDIKASVRTDLNTQEYVFRILVICTFAPTINHAGGLRIIDMLHKMKRKHARTYIEIFVGAHHDLLGPIGEITQIVDKVIFSDTGDFSFDNYLRQSLELSYFDVIDFQFPQPPHVVASYRNIGHKLIFTPMESHIRIECMDRGVEFIPQKDLRSRNAIEEAECENQVRCISIRCFVSPCSFEPITAAR